MKIREMDLYKHYAFFQNPYLYVCKFEFAIMLNKYSLN